MMPQASSLTIGNEGELDQYIAAAHIPGSWAVYSNMHLCVRSTHTTKRGMELNAEFCIKKMEDTQLGASRCEAIHKTEQPQ